MRAFTKVCHHGRIVLAPRKHDATQASINLALTLMLGEVTQRRILRRHCAHVWILLGTFIGRPSSNVEFL